MKKIYDSITAAVGNTPVVRLSRFGANLPIELLAKCEFLNAGGSVKDRIGVRMIEEAEKAGRIKPGDTLIEPTSGNTGIGIALTAAVRGYRVIITMPEKMSHEKQVVLEALGAEIIRTPTEAAWDSPESHIGVAQRLNGLIPNSHILDQYGNPDNPEAHYAGTAGEILDQLDGHLDVLVATAGTGGTISGIARRLKEELPSIRVVGVDPIGSILGGGTEIRPYKVEGIGYDFIPDVLDRSLIDEWIKVDDRNSFLTARRLIREEGLLCGGSSGSCAWAALQVARSMPEGQRCLVILPDSIRNYLTKFVDEKWMRDNRFQDSPFGMGSVGDILRSQTSRTIQTVDVGDTVEDAIAVFKSHGISQVPVLDDGRLSGILTEHDVLLDIVSGRCTPATSVAKTMNRTVRTISMDQPASVLSEVFNREEVGLVVDDEGQLSGVLTKIDLVEMLANRGVSADVS